MDRIQYFRFTIAEFIQHAPVFFVEYDKFAIAKSQYQPQPILYNLKDISTVYANRTKFAFVRDVVNQDHPALSDISYRSKSLFLNNNQFNITVTPEYRIV